MSQQSKSGKHWTLLPALIGLPNFAPDCLAFQWLAFALTCSGSSPKANLSRAGVNPSFLFHPEVRFRTGEASKALGDDFNIDEGSFAAWVSLLSFYNTS
jgi:hypothetical protein